MPIHIFPVKGPMRQLRECNLPVFKVSNFVVLIGTIVLKITATAKHYINNEQEHFRDSSSSNVDDRYDISLKPEINNYCLASDFIEL